MLEWKLDGDGVEVRTAKGTYRAARLVVTAGAWATRLLADIGVPLTVMRQVMQWFAPIDATLSRRDRFPIYIADTPDGAFYGRAGDRPARAQGGPALRRPGVAVPEGVDWDVHDADEAPVRAFLRQHLPAGDGPRTTGQVCMYTLTPNRHFVIDVHPRTRRWCWRRGSPGTGSSSRRRSARCWPTWPRRGGRHSRSRCSGSADRIKAFTTIPGGSRCRRRNPQTSDAGWGWCIARLRRGSGGRRGTDFGTWTEPPRRVPSACRVCPVANGPHDDPKSVEHGVDAPGDGDRGRVAARRDGVAAGVDRVRGGGAVGRPRGASGRGPLSSSRRSTRSVCTCNANRRRQLHQPSREKSCVADTAGIPSRDTPEFAPWPANPFAVVPSRRSRSKKMPNSEPTQSFEGTIVTSFFVAADKIPQVETTRIERSQLVNGEVVGSYEIRVEVARVDLSRHAYPPPMGGHAGEENHPDDPNDPLLKPFKPAHLPFVLKPPPVPRPKPKPGRGDEAIRAGSTRCSGMMTGTSSTPRPIPDARLASASRRRTRLAGCW